MAEENYWLKRQRLGRRRFLQASAAGASGAAAFALVGCGDDADTPAATGTASASSSPGTTTTAAPSATREAAKPGGTLRITTSNDNKRGFDPMHPSAWSNFEGDRNRAIYNNLLQLKADGTTKPDEQTIVGDLIAKASTQNKRCKCDILAGWSMKQASGPALRRLYRW